jgi:hypothetical protein
MQKYSDGDSFEYSDKMLGKVLVIQIKIENMTGKKSGY